MAGQTRMYSTKLIDLHFWVATIGVVLYIAAMWIAGVMQGLMWRAVNADGTLTYTFVESVKATYPYYVVRFLGGLLYLAGWLPAPRAGCPTLASTAWRRSCRGVPRTMTMWRASRRLLPARAISHICGRPGIPSFLQPRSSSSSSS